MFVSKDQQAVYKFDVSISIQHEILRLQVSVEDSVAVEIVEGFGDTANAESGRGLVKASPGEKRAEVQIPPVRCFRTNDLLSARFLDVPTK